MDSSDKYIGMLLDNRYEILERIGTGGMAFVYKARCHRLNRFVAIKILKEDLAGDDEFRRRFQTESQAVAMLSHPNIVAVYDVSSFNNIEFIVMELIEGITLKQYINRKGLLGWKEALHFSTQITKALIHAHSRGIIHRDIKPHNIMILKDGSVKVADFGIARLLSVQNTLTQDALGSVHYISPEQAKGGHVDARSDIYSVGVVMYEMLTSRLPFVGDSAVSVAIQHISAIPLMPRDLSPDIPEGLEQITMHAMEPDLGLRYATADELLLDLEEFRKNPAVTFEYTDAVYDGPADDQSTRKIPASGAMSVVERSLPQPKPKPVRVAKKPEMTRDEYRYTRRKASRTSTLIGVFSIIVFLVVVIVFMWKFLLQDIFNPEQLELTVPNFVDMKYTEMTRDASVTQYYEFNATYESSDTIEADVVIKQISPKAGAQMSLPSSGKINVEIVVSSGKEPPVYMPSLANKHYIDAKNELENLSRAHNLNLLITYKTAASDTVTKDYVIQTVPEVGSMLAKDNIVEITYSTGPEIVMVPVPNVEGYLLNEAIKELDKKNLTYDYLYVADDSPKDTVIYVSKVGEEVPPYTKISLHVSLGPPEVSPTDTESPLPTDSEPPTESPSPTDTVSPSPTDSEPPTDSPPPTEPSDNAGGVVIPPTEPEVP